jgi:hypothetical protein
MILTPTFLNSLIFWIQDNFLQKKNYSQDQEEIIEIHENEIEK